MEEYLADRMKQRISAFMLTLNPANVPVKTRHPVAAGGVSTGC
jgi:hypothetical protein